MAAVDVNADGVISVTEAAHSGWVGGKNCNHGGYVSRVAHGTARRVRRSRGPEATTDEGSAEDSDHAAIETSTGTAPVAADCSEEAPEADEATTRPRMPLARHARLLLRPGRRSSWPR